MKEKRAFKKQKKENISVSIIIFKGMKPGLNGPPTTIKRQVYSGPESEYDEEKNDDQSPQEHSFVCCVSVSDIYSALGVSSKDLRLLITSSSGKLNSPTE